MLTNPTTDAATKARERDDAWIERANRYFEGLPADPRAVLAKDWAPGSDVADVVMHEVWKRDPKVADLEARAQRAEADAERLREKLCACRVEADGSPTLCMLHSDILDASLADLKREREEARQRIVRLRSEIDRQAGQFAEVVASERTARQAAEEERDDWKRSQSESAEANRTLRAERDRLREALGTMEAVVRDCIRVAMTDNAGAGDRLANLISRLEAALSPPPHSEGPAKEDS